MIVYGSLKRENGQGLAMQGLKRLILISGLLATIS
jgi:hypothetical protein